MSFSNDQYSQTNNCGTSLAGNASCTVNVVFSPTGLGPQAATLTITSNTPASPHVINLTGNGIQSPGIPVLTSISPNHVISGGPSLTITAVGSNFAPGSTVLFNGSPRPTTFVDTNTLSAALPAGYH